MAFLRFFERSRLFCIFMRQWSHDDHLSFLIHRSLPNFLSHAKAFPSCPCFQSHTPFCTCFSIITTINGSLHFSGEARENLLSLYNSWPRGLLFLSTVFNIIFTQARRWRTTLIASIRHCHLTSQMAASMALSSFSVFISRGHDGLEICGA
jgi:hypothetical protein